MAANFKNVRASLGTSLSDIYTVPSGTTAVIIGCQATNVYSQARTFDLVWSDASNADVETYLADGIIIPSTSSYEPIGGKLVLESQDKLRGLNEGAGHVEITVSVLELS